MYRLILDRVFRYKMIVEGFTKTDSLFFRSIDIINIIANIKVLLKSKPLIRINMVMDVLSSKVKVKLKSTPTITIYPIKISALSKIKQKVFPTINIPLNISYLSKLKVKASSIIAFQITIVTNAIVGKFYKLVEHDFKTLGDMDILTLRELDNIEY